MCKRYGRTEKSKGLRHFSTKVCEKVKEKGRTNYNEVADELVAEYFDSVSIPSQDAEKQNYDMKNIRRRVYDALNVLMAMNIIEKEKKEIRWVGLPTSSLAECRKLEEEKAMRSKRIQEKTESLYDLVMQLVAYKSLVERNRERERAEGRPADNSILYLPYVIVNTDKSSAHQFANGLHYGLKNVICRTVVDCNISRDKSEFVFQFDHPFEIQDDIEILKRLGLTQGLDSGEVADELRPKINACLPLTLRQHIDPIIDGALMKMNEERAKAPGKVFEKIPGTSSTMSGGTAGGRSVMMRVPAPRAPSTTRFVSMRAQMSTPTRYVSAPVVSRPPPMRYYAASSSNGMVGGKTVGGGGTAGPSNTTQYVMRDRYLASSVHQAQNPSSSYGDMYEEVDDFDM